MYPNTVARLGPRGGGGGLGVVANTETQTLYNAMAGAGAAPTGARLSLMDALIGSLKSAGVWSRLDTLFVLAAHSATAASFNWKDPTKRLTAVSSPIFTTDRGYAGDGVSAYLDTGNDISAGQYAQNDHHLAMWVQNGAAAAPTQIGSVRNRMNSRDASDQFVTRSCASANGTDANTTNNGHFAFSRDNSANYKSFRAGVVVATKTQATIAPTSENWFILTFNNGGSPSGSDARRIGAAHSGASLSEAQMLAARNALANYMTAVGA